MLSDFASRNTFSHKFKLLLEKLFTFIANFADNTLLVNYEKHKN